MRKAETNDSLPDFLKDMVSEEESGEKDPSHELGLGGVKWHSGSIHSLTGATVVVCRTAPVKTWKISFSDVTQSVYKDEWQHWNINYAKARLILDQEDKAANRRAALVCKAHDVLFKPKAGTTGVHLKTGAEFVDVFKGVKMSTFALNDKYLYVGETGLGAKDWLSKHALHCRAAQNVRCAGTLWINEQGGIVICNDSGTYAPSERSLELFKQVLNQVLPDLVVEVKPYKE